jgi:hypothetical protein
MLQKIVVNMGIISYNKLLVGTNRMESFKDFTNKLRNFS